MGEKEGAAMQGYIGFFDSGIGGLTLLSECAALLPGEKFVYLGDNARAPYGGRPEGEIRAFAAEAFGALSAYPLKAAVIACNTVTADAADRLRAVYPFPIVGVEPAVRPALLSGARRVLVLATKATLSSPRFAALCASCGGEGRVAAYAPDGLAGDIEKNIFRKGKVDLSSHLPEVPCDAVVLGCTHYIFLKREIGDFYGCRVFDGNAGAARRLASLLVSERETGVFLQNAGTADHRTIKTNICSKKCKKSPKKSVVFLGKAKNKNKKVYFSLF